MHSFTIATTKHRAISVSFVIVDRYGLLVHEFTYTGDDVIVQFIRNVLHCEDVMVNARKFNECMIFNEKGRHGFEKTPVSFICNNNICVKETERLFPESGPKLRHHGRLTRIYLGAAHKTGNWNK